MQIPTSCTFPPDIRLELEAAGGPPAYGHLFKVRHHAMMSTEKARRLVGYRWKYDLRSGHEHTYDWFRAQGFDQLSGPLIDPVWKASYDFEHEATVAGRIRG